jgi:hypothetical protein
VKRLEQCLQLLVMWANAVRSVSDSGLAPTFGSLVALRELVISLVESLVRWRGQPGHAEAWKYALPKIMSSVVGRAASSEQPWQHVVEATRRTASAHPESTQPLSRLCRAFLPAHSELEFLVRMLRAARPISCPADGRAWIERCTLSEATHDGTPPAALWFRWIAG